MQPAANAVGLTYTRKHHATCNDHNAFNENYQAQIVCPLQMKVPLLLYGFVLYLHCLRGHVLLQGNLVLGNSVLGEQAPGFAGPNPVY